MHRAESSRNILGGRGNMRFKFCGDVDPPEWLLSEIGLLSRIVLPT